MSNYSEKYVNKLLRRISELSLENAELKELLKKEMIMQLVLYGNRIVYTGELKDLENKIKAEGIREGAEVVAEALQKENFPTPQALAMGRFYTDLLDYANELEQSDD